MCAGRGLIRTMEVVCRRGLREACGGYCPVPRRNQPSGTWEVVWASGPLGADPGAVVLNVVRRKGVPADP